MRYHVMLVSPFWKNHKIPQGLLISCYFVTFVVPSSEAASKHLFFPQYRITNRFSLAVQIFPRKVAEEMDL